MSLNLNYYVHKGVTTGKHIMAHQVGSGFRLDGGARYPYQLPPVPDKP